MNRLILILLLQASMVGALHAKSKPKPTPAPSARPEAAAAEATTADAQPTKEYPYFGGDVMKWAEEDAKKMPPEGCIVFIGSSSIKKWKRTMKTDLAPYPVVNRGFGGSKADQALFYADKFVIPYKPSKVFFYEGENDLMSSTYKLGASGKSPSEFSGTPEKFVEDCKKFAAKVLKALPDTKIYFISIKPCTERVAKWPKFRKGNELLKQFTATDPRLTYVDVATPMFDEKGEVMPDLFVSDKVHMNAKGYAIWTKVIRKYLEDDKKPSGEPAQKN